MRHSVNSAVGVLVVALLAAPVMASPDGWDELGRGGERGIVVDQQPTRGGGLAADTEFYDTWGDPYWQQLADDILLSSAATIRRVLWSPLFQAC